MKRAEAIALGLIHYNGTPCKHCQRTVRSVTDYNCVTCARDRSKARMKKLRETGDHLEAQRRYEKTDLGKANRARYGRTDSAAGSRWKYSITRKYGITEQEYNSILENQNSRCKICGLTPEENGKKLAVDHCHKTGVIRSLLCHNCNVGLGNFKDSIDILQRAIRYLQEQ